MAFWDDVIRNVFGGGEKQEAPSRPKPTPSSSSRQTRPAYKPAGLSSGGGRAGGPGMASMSVGGGAPAPTQRPNEKPRDFWDYIGVSQRAAQDRADFAGDFWRNVGGAVGGALERSGDAAIRRAEGQQDMAAVVMGNPNAFEERESANARDAYAQGLGSQNLSGTVQISPEQWATYTPEQQQGLIANYALYKAVEEDRRLGQKVSDLDPEETASYQDSIDVMFGKEGGSETYAPNTARVLRELGYTNTEVGDIDHFLNGSAISTLDQVLAGNQGARGEVFTALGAAPAFTENETYRAQLDKGAAILEALRDSGTFSVDVSRQAGVPLTARDQIPEDRREALDNVLMGMANQSVWDTIQTDAEVNRQLSEDITNATQGLDPGIVNNYFREVYGNLQNAMPQQQFEQYWLKG